MSKLRIYRNNSEFSYIVPLISHITYLISYKYDDISLKIWSISYKIGGYFLHKIFVIGLLSMIGDSWAIILFWPVRMCIYSEERLFLLYYIFSLLSLYVYVYVYIVLWVYELRIGKGGQIEILLVGNDPLKCRK